MIMVKEPTRTGLSIDILQLTKAALVFRAINHQLRQQLLNMIHKVGKITVTELYKNLRLEQSVVSQHLAILRNTGFVITQRDGKQIHYSVNYPRLQHEQAVAKELLKSQ